MANPLIRNLEQFGAPSHAEKAACKPATGIVISLPTKTSSGMGTAPATAS
jgi:hypothetical protein